MDSKKTVLLIVLGLGIVAMTIAFAALSTTLRISGTASVPNTNWNIHFANWALDTASTVTVGSNTQQNTASYPTVAQLQQSLAPNVTLVEGINVTLYQPNDYVKYTFNIVNEGTIDASLDNFTHTMTCESGKNCDFLEYTVECQDSQLNTVTNNYVLPHGQSVSCFLQLKFKDVNNVAKNNTNANNLQASVVNGVYTQEATSATLAANWSWIQKQVSQAQGGNSGGNEPVTPSNPYETTFDGEYIGYKWYDAEPIYNLDFNVATSGSDDGSCPSGYEYYSGGEFSSIDEGCYLNAAVDENGWYSTLNSESKAYLRTTGSLSEVCGVFGSGQSGTVCMTSSYYNSSYSSAGNYVSDFEDVSPNGTVETISELEATGLKGYALAKAEEMLTKGASSCEVSSYYVDCRMSGNAGYCSIDYDGYVNCGGLSVYDDGSTN